MAVALELVVKQLTDSGIIALGKLEPFIPPQANPKSVDELVAQLVKEHHLTPFQAAQVKAGKAKALILGEYTILDKIGAGGMGQVFKAQHRRMKRLVAIKMLPPAMTKDAAALARFEREVEAAAKLSHPNIVAAHDAGQSGAAHFLVMEYVDGRDLSATVKKDGPLPVNKAVHYILQAARGLEFAHRKGVVHRDIKPANLLLDSEGVVKILDMGLARIEQADGGAGAELTGTGTIMGTVDYMSPEQALDTRHADARADIYSLGMSLYYLLAGKAAYGGDTAMQKLMAHQNQPIPSLQDVQSTVSKQLDAVFRKMVAKKIDGRYQTMSEVVEALEALGYGGTGTLKRGEIASTLDLSSADKKKLAAQAKKQALSSITDVVASEKSKNLILKIVGGSFGTIIAPILVFYLIRHLEKTDQPANPPAATVAATADGPLVAGTLRVPPAGTPSDVARSSADGTRSVPATLKAPFDAAAAKAGQAAWAKHLGTQVETTNSVGMRMTLIPPGEFLMGSTPEQVAWGRTSGEDDKMRSDDYYFDRLPEEMPQHKVRINQPFLMSSTEVTVAQFRKFVEATEYITDAENGGSGSSRGRSLGDKGRNWKNPGYPTTDDTVVTQITWNDAVAYCAWLSDGEQRRPWYRPDGKGGWLIAALADGYRLPTEAEWEYACRAGTTTQFSFGDDKRQLEQYGWFNKDAGGRAHPVALKLPNPFGLFDVHGNAQEWCQDWFDEKWYEKSPATDPSGPSSGLSRVIRGGNWSNYASNCRSAFRNNGRPSKCYGDYGFRIVRPLDASHPETAVVTAAKPSVSPTKPTKPWETPEFQKWVADTGKLPAEQQIEAVSKKLMELNPGFDGKLRGMKEQPPKIERGFVTNVGFYSDKVVDISPVRVFEKLRLLNCYARGSTGSRLSDLSPLQGMPLNTLQFDYTSVADLSPLRSMPLERLNCRSTLVDDLTALHECAALKSLIVVDCAKLPTAQVAALQKVLPNCEIEWPKSKSFYAPPSKLAWLDPAFQKWVADTQKLPAEKQIEAVSKKLMELNPGFDGKVRGYDRYGPPKVENGKVTECGFDAEDVTDISPVRALPGLKALDCSGGNNRKGERLSDLSPLNGMELTMLDCSDTMISDLSPLEGMPLTSLSCFHTKIWDLSPLHGMPLTFLSFHGTQVSDLSPLTGMPLTSLNCADTKVQDLSPLAGASLVQLWFAPKNITKGIEVVRQMRSLRSIAWRGELSRVEFWRMYDAGDFAKLERPAAANRQQAAKPKKLAYLDPAFQQWIADTQKLPAEKQIEAVSKKLMELNPGFDGKVGGFDFRTYPDTKPKVDGNAVTVIGFLTDKIADLSPVRVFSELQHLDCSGSVPGKKGLLSDLSPLMGMPLVRLNCSESQVADLSALRGMRLTWFACGNTQVTSLSPLKGMPLKLLLCSTTPIRDLSPLEGMLLTDLSIHDTPISDLSALRGMPLKGLNCYRITATDFTPLEGMKLTEISMTPASVRQGIDGLRNMTTLSSPFRYSVRAASR